MQKINEKIKQHSSLLVAATSISAVILTIICLSEGITIIFPLIYYVPIILTAYYYPKKGILFSVFISTVYLSLIALIGNPTPEIRASAMIRVVIFITVAALVSYHINKQRKTEDAVKQKLNLEIATLKISSLFSGEYNLKENIEKALRIMGTLSNADRVYLFLLRDEGRIMYNAYEWCANGVSPQIDNLQDLPSDMFPWWMKKLEKGETINISDVSRIPPEAEAEKKILESQDIKSILVLPVRGNSRLEGFIGFDNVKEAKEWKDEDLSLLTITATTIGKAIEIRKCYDEVYENERFLQGVFDAIQDGISVIDNDLKILRVNRWVEIKYASQAPLQGRKCYVVYQQRESPCPWCPSLRAIETGKVQSEIIPYPSEENPTGWIYLTAFPLKDSDGDVTGVIDHVKDITDLKSTEEALRESEEKFRSLAVSTPVGIMLYQDNRFIYSNPAAEEGCGYSKEELRLMNFWDFVHPDYTELVKERGRARQKGEKPVNRYELKIITKNGKERWIYLIGSSLMFSGRPAGIISVTDITDRKATEARIEHLNSVLLAVRDLSPVITHETDPVRLIMQAPEVLTRTNGFHNVWVALFDDSGHVTAAAESGLSEEVFRQIRECLDTGVLPPCVRSALAEEGVIVTEDPASDCPDCPLSTTCIEGRAAMTTRLESGGRVYGIISLTIPGTFVTLDEEQALFMEVARDIAFALHVIDMEKERVTAHQRMIDILEFLPDATFVIDSDGKVITWNRAMEEMTGVKAEEMIGKGDYEYAVPFYGERREILIDLVFAGEDEVMQKGYSDIHRDGDILIADTTLPRPLGKTEVLMVTASPLYDSSGRVVGAIESIRDITDRKQMEDEIVQSLKEKEVLLKEIHHRVKNNIQVISSLFNIQVKQTKDPGVKEIFREMQNKVKSIALIHEKLYQSERFSQINYGDYLNDIATYMLQSYGVDPTRVSVHINSEDVTIDINKAVPCSLIINELLSNAFKHAFPGERTGEIVIDFRKKDEKNIIRFSDNGVGLAEAVTLDHPETLGMQLIKGLTHQLNGTISVDRTGGTKYTIIFPADSDEGGEKWA